ncbi:MAG: hypothetical protein PHR77_10815 [Kiritimatiellae bacterium]|nr:hypothetical protein [Kiritimatiellia bacterium]MDD5522130.1 hypothetical protein [Kiritimatiellia bacterium]
MENRTRYLASDIPARFKRPVVKLQPVMSKEGEPNIDLGKLSKLLNGIGEIAEPVIVKTSASWSRAIKGIGRDVDAILPVSITAYPTDLWNAYPMPLRNRGLPLVFWPIIKYDEPDFWRWATTDFLRAVGVDVHLVQSNRHGLALVRALGMKRFLKGSKIVVFGEQNFPWNAPAAGHLVTKTLGTKIVVRPLSDIKNGYKKINDKEIDKIWNERRKRYLVTKDIDPDALKQAVRTYLVIKKILEDEEALGFGVNCFGDLIIKGGRDVPCLAQTLLREDGYIASCDGDYLAMMSMVLTTFFLDKTCMMSNMYPVLYKGALSDHFGDPLSPDGKYPGETWNNLARLAHCGFAGIVSPEMTPEGKTALHDWGGTYEIKRDGRGCGLDGNLAAGEKATMLELKFDGKTFLVGSAEVCETTRHKGMPHCESSVLIEFKDLKGYVKDISREHTVLVYGDHVIEFEVLARVLGLECKVFA